MIRLPAGRLFRKFFLAFFLAQMLTVVSIGFLIWVAGPEPHLPEPEDRQPPGEDREALTTDVPLGPFPDARRPDASLPGEAMGIVADQLHGRIRHGLWHPRRHGYPFLPVGLGLVGSLLFAFLLARNVSGPIIALRRAFLEVGRGNLKVRLGPGTARVPDELESLRTDFDITTARLQVLVEGQRRLLHDVSHEVRSPVARLQLALDLIRQQPARAAELLDRMERECGRIDRLMEELLTLSRLEARAFGSLDQVVDLAEILQMIGEDAEFEAEPHAIEIRLQIPQTLSLLGHADLLHRAIENVVRNALIHSPKGGVVTLHASASSNQAQWLLTIEDQGPGVPAADLEAMFLPFKRLADSSHGDGHGLGLAISREAIRAHGGRIVAENRSEGGLRVRIELPREHHPEA